MAYRPGDIARAGLFVALPLAAGVLATPAEVVWALALFISLLAIKPFTPYAGPATAVYGLLVFARLAARVPARGVTALVAALAALAALAFILASIRRRETHLSAAAAALVVLTTVGAVAAAVLWAEVGTLNLAFAPLAVLVAWGAVLLGPTWGGAGRPAPTRGVIAALAVGAALGGLRLGAAFGLTLAAQYELAGADAGSAQRLAAWSSRLGGGPAAEVTALAAADAAGASWDVLFARYKSRDRLASPRPYDAVMAEAALRRGDYDGAAAFADLATSRTPMRGNQGPPLKKREMERRLAAAATDGRGRAWTTLWAGRYNDAAASFARLGGPDNKLWAARALERGGDVDAAARFYFELWRDEPENFAAAFGMLRTSWAFGLRPLIWRKMITPFPRVYAGEKFKAADGMVMSYHRRSLGRTPATITVEGPGRRRVALIAAARECDGLWPIVAMTVNGAAVKRFYVNTAGEDIYETTAAFRPGGNTLGLVFENDYADASRGVDRDVYVSEVRLSEVSGGR